MQLSFSVAASRGLGGAPVKHVGDRELCVVLGCVRLASRQFNAPKQRFRTSPFCDRCERSLSHGEKQALAPGRRIRRLDSERYINDHGYAVVRVGPGEWRAEHRVLMEAELGRRLRRSESVHHINGVRDDNRLENLQLRFGAHGPGQAWCCAECGSRSLVPAPLPE